jgi:hypothetical protein
MLCDRCSIAISDILTCSLDSSRWKAEPFAPGSHVFYLGDQRKIAENSSRKICFVCQTTQRRLSSEPRDDLEPLDNGELKPYFFSVQLEYTSSEPPQPWAITIRGLPNPRMNKEGYFTVHFELYLCGTPPDRPDEEIQPHQLDVKIPHDLYSRLGTPWNDNSGSEDAIWLAMSWSTHCIRFHPECCGRKQEHKLPTRVIDVGLGGNEPSDFQDLRLILTNGLRGHYASLSHRWSSISNQFCTTQNNFQQHMKYISLDRLPRTFRDSIILCRQLDIRYLWIDCLCIIQDDDKDWQQECEKMSDIFENSYLTISALRARDGDGGLFHLRKQDNTYLRAQDGTLLGLRRREYGLAEDVHVSSTGNRGWILQEKILSPALLHFGNSQMHWECKNATISEARAHTHIPGSGPLKYALHEAQRQGCHLYPQGHFIAWNMIMQRYSRMDLTSEYDRLPAILGLARRFQQSLRVTFVAGLWLEDLHRGLLWNRDRISTSRQSEQDHEVKQPRVLAKCATAPSWSWITAAGDSNFISFEWDLGLPHRRSPLLFFPAMRLRSDTDAEVVDATVTSCPEIHRGAV